MWGGRSDGKAGARIRLGHLIGLVEEEVCIDMCYSQLNDRGELMTGTCCSIRELMPDGKVRLHETWQWTSGDGSAGSSVLEEIWDPLYPMTRT